MSAATALQWVTAGAYLALFGACLWAGRRAGLRAAAVALGTVSYTHLTLPTNREV